MTSVFFRIPMAASLALLFAGTGCGEELELPQPPSLDELTHRYDNPTADLTEETADEIVTLFQERRERLHQINDLEVVTGGINEFASAAKYDEDGSIKIDGVPIHTDAVITLSGDCPGWSDDGDDGDFSFQVVVSQSVLIPVFWGQMQNCRTQRVGQDTTTNSSFSAAIEVHAPTVARTSRREQNILLAFDFFDMEIDGQELSPWTGNFRLINGVLELLLDTENAGSVVSYGDYNAQSIGVRAANGNWSCTPEERICESQNDSRYFSF